MPRIAPAEALVSAMSHARRRWRLRHLAVGAAVTLAAVAVAVGAASFALEAWRFSPDAVRWGRIVLGLVTVVVIVRFVAWPLMRRLPDDRLALYLEERVPALEGAVLSAVSVRGTAARMAHSPLLEQGLTADAARRLAHAGEVPTLERPATRRALGAFCALAVATMLLFATGPAFLRTGAALLLTPWRDPAAQPVYAISVEPRSVVVARGSDVQLGATLSGFESELVELVVRRGASAEFERIPMGAGKGPKQFIVRLFDVAEDAEYFVESSGVRSPSGHLTVRDLPGVARIGVELRFPSFMNLAPEVTEDGGDIAAPAGTTAILRIHATRAVRGGRLRFDGGSTVPLARLDDSTLTARLVVQRDGFYRVELEAEDGTVVAGTVEYVVDALEDASPVVRIRKPGRDLRPTNVDEVLIEAEATDDYGVAALELVYRVNGGAEQVIALAGGTAGGVRPREVIAAHTLFLEEMHLAAGDVVSYYARARDNDAIHGPKTGASDIQFMTIRPFNREYKQNQAGGGGGEGGEVSPGSLVQRERDIVAGTFKTERDRAKTPAATLRSDISTLHLAQGRLHEELNDLLQRVRRPAVQAADSGFRVLAEVLPKAGDEMKAAEELLVQGKTSEALAPEQRALQWLEKAEAAFREVQISMRQPNAGGGGGAAAKASDLADLLELETDKLRNQYDQVEQSREQQGARGLDEMAERLKRLAARQQQELSRQRERAQRGAGGGASGGGTQRQLAEETEQAARQLERLAREQQSAEMAQTAADLQKAAEAMRRSAASGGAAAAQAAADKLASAQRALNDKRDAQATAGLGEATRRAEALAEEQREVAKDVDQLAGAGANRAERQRRLDERKSGMQERVEGLARELDQLARDNRKSQPGAARQAEGAAAAIRDARIADKIRFSRQAMRTGSAEYTRNIEKMIQEDLDSLAHRVAQAARVAAAGRDTSQRATRALTQARDLVRGMSSIEQRVRERMERARGGPGANGEGQEGKGKAGQPSDNQPGGSGKGGPRGAGGNAGSFTAEDARQLARELRSERDAADQLRRSLNGTGVNTAELEKLIARLAQLDAAKILGDPAALEKMRTAVVEDLKAWEFALRRQLGASETAGPALGGNDNVPAAYKDLVSEYFKSLAKKP